jgi:hypothetical protein
MSDPKSGDHDQLRLEAALAAHTTGETSIRGPVHVLSSAAAEDGATTYAVTASTLVPLDADDPALDGVAIPLPVDATIVLDRDGSIADVSVAPVDPGAIREARAFARTLIDNGAVRGLPSPGPSGPAVGPPARATHQLTTEADGVKVIRRVGYSIAG